MIISRSSIRGALILFFKIVLNSSFVAAQGSGGNVEKEIEEAKGVTEEEMIPDMSNAEGEGLDQIISSYLPRNFMEPFHYDPRGRRDPFSPYVKIVEEEGDHHPLENFNLSQLILIGILWDVSKPQAMIKDPSGGIHLVGVSQRMGRNNGYIAVIREGEIVVVEEFMADRKVSFVTRVMQISQ